MSCTLNISLYNYVSVVESVKTHSYHSYIQVYCVHLFSHGEVKWETGVEGGWCLFNICCYSWGCCYRNNQVNGQEQEGNQRDVPICVILLKLNFSGGLGVFGEFAPYITRFYHLSIRPMNATSWRTLKFCNKIKQSNVLQFQRLCS